MRKNLIKLTALGAFSVFAVCAFFISQKPANAKEENILEAISDYKNWKQVNKPTEGTASPLTRIEFSSPGG